jgi:hypothetical protein
MPRKWMPVLNKNFPTALTYIMDECQITTIGCRVHGLSPFTTSVVKELTSERPRMPLIHGYQEACHQVLSLPVLVPIPSPKNAAHDVPDHQPSNEQVSSRLVINAKCRPFLGSVLRGWRRRDKQGQVWRHTMRMHGCPSLRQFHCHHRSLR